MTTAAGVGLLVLLWLVPIYVAQRIGHGRFSWLWGFCLGWIGVLTVWLWWRPVARE